MSRLAMSLQVLLLLACSGSAAAVSGNRGFLALASSMQPEVVAQTLASVEDKWTLQVAEFAECNATAGGGAECAEVSRVFRRSCTTVVAAVLQASSGDRAVVAEYMGDVCAEPALEGRRQEQCRGLAEELTGAMSPDNYDNREGLRADALCAALLTRFTAEESARAAHERAERKEATQHAEEEAAQAEEQRQQKEKTEEEKARAEASEVAQEPAVAEGVTQHVTVLGATSSDPTSLDSTPSTSAEAEGSPSTVETVTATAAAPPPLAETTPVVAMEAAANSTAMALPTKASEGSVANSTAVVLATNATEKATMPVEEPETDNALAPTLLTAANATAAENATKVAVQSTPTTANTTTAAANTSV